MFIQRASVIWPSVKEKCFVKSRGQKNSEGVNVHLQKNEEVLAVSRKGGVSDFETVEVTNSFLTDQKWYLTLTSSFKSFQFLKNY